MPNKVCPTCNKTLNIHIRKKGVDYCSNNCQLELRELFAKHKNELSPRQKAMFIKRIKEEKPFRVIGEEFGVSCERVREIVMKTIQNIQTYAKGKAKGE